MTAVPSLALAVLLGGGIGAGVLVMLWGRPTWRARTLSTRLAPYLRDLTEGDPTRAVDTVTFPSGFGPSGVRTGLLSRASAGPRTVPRAIRSWRRSAGLIWALIGLAGGSVLTIAALLSGIAQPGVVAMPLVGAVAGVALHCARLRAAARAHQRRIEEELPVILEFLALCLSAGEGLMDAIRRVSVRGTGSVAIELRRVVVDVGTGEPLADALVALTRRVESPPLHRAVDQIVSAMDRGTPLTDVLHAHALESRAEAQRSLIEQAGRKEIAMLVPLVFLILPVSVLFAIFPGIVMLRLG